MSEVETTEQRQTVQRVRVGMTGLAFILVLIALGSAIFSSASDEPPVTAAGAADEQTVSNLTAAVNEIDIPTDAVPDEPLAELGVAPSVATVEPANEAIASQISAEKQKDSSKAH